MKVQSIVFFGAVVILCILNIPGSPVSVKLSLTSVLLAVSTVSSGLIYYFLNNIPDTQYSLLVSSSKSVVVWHSIYTCSESFYLAYTASYYEEDQQNWRVEENDTCLFFPILYPPPIYATVLAQFQVVRFLFEVFPQQFLSLNHEAWAVPVTAAGPVTACILQCLAYFYKGTICDQLYLKWILIKLNFESKTTPFEARIQVKKWMYYLAVFTEILIQLKKRLRTLQTLIRKKRNKVKPAPVDIMLKSISNHARNDCNDRHDTIEFNSVALNQANHGKVDNLSRSSNAQAQNNSKLSVYDRNPSTAPINSSPAPVNPSPEPIKPLPATTNPSPAPTHGSPAPSIPPLTHIKPLPATTNPLLAPTNPSPAPYDLLPSLTNPSPEPINPSPAPTNLLPTSTNPLPVPSNSSPAPTNPSPEPLKPLPAPNNSLPAPSNSSLVSTNPLPVPSNSSPAPTNPSPEPLKPLPAPSNPLPAHSNPLPVPANSLPAPVNPSPELIKPLPALNNPLSVPTNSLLELTHSPIAPTNPLQAPTNPSPTPTSSTGVPSQRFINILAEKLNIILFFSLLGLFLLTVFFRYGDLTIFVAIVMFDFFYYALPPVIIWNSQKISGFLKHKITQIRLDHDNF